MLLFAFLLVVAVVIDGGKVLVAKRQAQNAVDAAALAAAADASFVVNSSGVTELYCEQNCRDTAARYLEKNGYHGEDGGDIPECDEQTGLTMHCFTVDAPVGTNSNMVRIGLKTNEQLVFAKLLDIGAVNVSASAAATAGEQTSSLPGTTILGTTDPGMTYVETQTVVSPGAPASIFVRGDFCSSFFFPGSGNHVSGVVTNGGVGNFPSGNKVDSIQMNHYWYNQHNCSYPTVAGAPHPPSFWLYDANGNPLDGAGPDQWVVPFPDLAAVMHSTDPAMHCLYSSHTTVGEVTSDGVTATTDGPHCLRAGDQVTVSYADSRLGSGVVTVTGATATTFSYAKSGVAFSRTVTKKVLQNGVATLTLSGTSPVFVKGDLIAVSGVDSTFDCARCTVTNVTTTTVSYAIPGAANVSAASGGRVDFVGSTGKETYGAIPTITSTWKAANPPGIYVIDAPYGTTLTISAASTNFAGYTWIAPEIALSGTGDTFSNYSGAPQAAVFYAYNPNGDAVHESYKSFITGSIFCGPAEPNASNPNPTNKCWFGGNYTTFTGLMEAWHIEWKLSYGDFNGTGPPVGTTTGISTFTVIVPGLTTVGTVVPDQIVTTGTTVGGLGE